MGTELQFRKTKQVLEMDDSDGCTTIFMYIRNTQEIINNGTGHIEEEDRRQLTSPFHFITHVLFNFYLPCTLVIQF